MFSKGDRVVYGQTGVCEIIDICEKALIKNQKKLYYVLNPFYQQNNTIYAPVEGKVLIRPIMTALEAEDLILKIPEIRDKLKTADLTPDDCRAALATGNCDSLVELTARIYAKKKFAQSQKKKLGFSDEKYMHLAENLLFGELAVALGIEIQDVEKYIAQKIENK